MKNQIAQAEYSAFNTTNRKGSILLIVLGILAILSMLGTTMIFMTRQELAESKNFIDQTRAKFAAESGVEDAMARLYAYSGVPARWDLEFATIPNDPSLPLEFLSQCSFGKLDTDGDGKKDSAGAISNSYVNNGDSYSLRVSSAQNKLNINDSNQPLNWDSDPYEDQLYPENNLSAKQTNLQPAGAQDPDWLYPGNADYDDLKGKGKPYPKAPGRLWNIVSELCGVLFPSSPALKTSVPDAIFAARAELPGDKFENVEQMKVKLVPSILDEGQYQLLESYFTLYSWRDPDTIRPTFQWKISRPATDPVFYFNGDFIECPWAMWAGMVLHFPFPTLADRTIFGTESFGEINSSDIYLYSDMQTDYFELEPRSPINVNYCDLKLLKTLLRPIQGWYLREAPMADEATTVEDWSQPAFNKEFMNSGNGAWAVDYHHPWFGGAGQLSYWAVPHDTSQCGCTPLVKADRSRFYCFDESEKGYFTLDLNSSTGKYFSSIQYCKKSNRFGRLEKCVLTPAIADAVAVEIYYRINASLPKPGPGPAEKMSALSVSDPNFKPFVTWETFENFILDLADGNGVNDLAGFDEYMAHMVIANFNPNSRINDFNPDKGFYLHIDKSQLINNTTEFCFNSGGMFNIESLGEVKAAGNTVKAKAKIKTTAKLLEQFRISSQAQFMKGYDPASSKEASAILGASNGESPTKGLKFDGGVLDTGYSGHTLQCYPEPERVEGNGSPANAGFINSSMYDGFLKLSTHTPNLSDTLSETSGKFFYADFNGSLRIRPLIAGENLHCIGDVSGEQWIKSPFPYTMHQEGFTGTYGDWSTWVMGWAEDANACQPGNYPGDGQLTRDLKVSENLFQAGNLYPDGAYSETGRSLSFLPNGIGANPNGAVGAMQFWLKPGFDPAHSNRIRQFVSLNAKVGSNNMSVGGYTPPWIGGEFSLYYFGHGGTRINPITDNNIPLYSADQEGECFSTRSLFLHNYSSIWTWSPVTMGMGTTTANQSWRAQEDANLSNPLYQFEARQWTHIALSWEPWLAADADHYDLRMAVNGVPVEQELRASLSGAGGPGTIRSNTPQNYARFGESSSAPWGNNPADSTFDCIISSNAYEDYDALRLEYGYGRYYNMNDAAYTSPKFDLRSELALNSNQTLTLHSVSWTMYWPKNGDSSQPANALRFNENRLASNSDSYNSVTGVIQPIVAGKPLYPFDPMWTVWGARYMPCSVDIALPDETGFFYEGNGIAKTHMPSFAGGSVDEDWSNSPLRWKAGQNFQFRIHFNITEGQTLYASPLLDDITFQFKLANPSFFYWNLEG